MAWLLLFGLGNQRGWEGGWEFPNDWHPTANLCFPFFSSLSYIGLFPPPFSSTSYLFPLLTLTSYVFAPIIPLPLSPTNHLSPIIPCLSQAHGTLHVVFVVVVVNRKEFPKVTGWITCYYHILSNMWA